MWIYFLAKLCLLKIGRTRFCRICEEIPSLLFISRRCELGWGWDMSSDVGCHRELKVGWCLGRDSGGWRGIGGHWQVAWVLLLVLDQDLDGRPKVDLGSRLSDDGLDSNREAWGMNNWWGYFHQFSFTYFFPSKHHWWISLPSFPHLFSPILSSPFTQVDTVLFSHGHKIGCHRSVVCHGCQNAWNLSLWPGLNSYQYFAILFFDDGWCFMHPDKVVIFLLEESRS